MIFGLDHSTTEAQSDYIIMRVVRTDPTIFVLSVLGSSIIPRAEANSPSLILAYLHEGDFDLIDRH